MHSKIIFFVATIYIVNASVIKSKVYNDDPQIIDDSEEEHAVFNLKDVVPKFEALNRATCVNSVCNRECTRKSYPGGGVCVRGRCRCKLTPTNEEVMPTNDINNEVVMEMPEEPNVHLDKEEQADDVLSMLEEFNRKCVNSACNRQCTQKGYPGGGVCVGGRCRCTLTPMNDVPASDINNKVMEMPEEPNLHLDREEQTDDVLSMFEELNQRKCINSECNRDCTKKGYPGGGVCVFGRCRCKLAPTNEELIPIYDVNNEVVMQVPEEP